MLDQLTPVVKSLIAINVVFYIGTVFLAPQLYDTFALYFFEDPRFEFWQPLTHMFMHDDVTKENGSLMHIVFNMYGLFLFGPPLEKWMGTNRFIFFYFASGLGAYLLTTGIDFYQYFSIVEKADTVDLINISQTDYIIQEAGKKGIWKGMVGASGCLFGVLAGFAYLYPNVKLMLLFIPFPVKAKYLIGAYVVYETLSVLGILSLQNNVGHAAHLGGAIFGFIMIWYWKRDSMDKYRWN